MIIMMTMMMMMAMMIMMVMKVPGCVENAKRLQLEPESTLT